MKKIALQYVRPDLTKRLLAVCLLFAYTLIFRTWGVSSLFWLHGDQIRDWSIALGSWRDLPLNGVPSNAGGTTLGPVYYWVLWVIRHLIGPFTDNLPHAGGIGLSIIQSLSEALLFAALWRRSESIWLALGVCLLLASQPQDMGLDVAISNPPLAVAFVKMAIAVVLVLNEHSSLWWTVAATAAAWFAVQAHSTAIFISAPLIASLPLSEAVARRWASAARRLRASFDVILLLELPFLVSVLNAPGQAAGPGKVFSSLADTIHHPESLHLAATYETVAEACRVLLLEPWSPAWFGAFLLICAAATGYRFRRDVSLVSITIAPIAAFVMGFALYQQPLDPYYCMPIIPSVALTIAFALTMWRPSARLVSIAFAVAVILWQPSRRATSMNYYRFPEYGVLARGSREIRRRVPEIRFLETEFAIPSTVDGNYLYSILGGRFTQDAPYSAVISPTGDVRFKLVKP